MEQNYLMFSIYKYVFSIINNLIIFSAIIHIELRFAKHKVIKGSMSIGSMSI